MFENWVIRKTLGPKKIEATGGRSKCITNIFIICGPYQILGW